MKLKIEEVETRFKMKRLSRRNLGLEVLTKSSKIQCEVMDRNRNPRLKTYYAYIHHLLLHASLLNHPRNPSLYALTPLSMIIHEFRKKIEV